MTRQPTPVETWAPAFRYFRKLTLSNTITAWGQCKCCDQPVHYSERADHAAQHDKELREWKRANPEGRSAA